MNNGFQISDLEFQHNFLKYVKEGNIRQFNIEWIKRFRTHNSVTIVGDDFTLVAPPLRNEVKSIPDGFTRELSNILEGGDNPLTQKRLLSMEKRIEIKNGLTDEQTAQWAKVFSHYGLELMSDEETPEETNPKTDSGNTVVEYEDWD